MRAPSAPEYRTSRRVSSSALVMRSVTTLSASRYTDFGDGLGILCGSETASFALFSRSPWCKFYLVRVQVAEQRPEPVPRGQNWFVVDGQERGLRYEGDILDDDNGADVSRGGGWCGFNPDFSYCLRWVREQ